MQLTGNTLRFETANEYFNTDDGHGSAGTVDSNPGGLIYEAKIDYYADGETAWGEGLEFPGKNWGMHFMYTVQEPPPVLVDTVTVPSNGYKVCSNESLSTGVEYLLEASGTYYYRKDGVSIADAEWAQRPVGDPYNPTESPIWLKGEGTYKTEFGLDISLYDTSYTNLDWGDLNLVDHTYTTSITGDGSGICFSIFDSYYGDNSGSLTLSIYLP